MKNRIEARMAELRANNEKAFITYMTAGLPNIESTKDIIKAQVGNTDVIELGIPFSDPIADGSIIQQASYEAILNGATLNKTFKLMEEIRNEGITQPIVFMLYYNTIVNVGLEIFVERCHKAGVDGLIIPDLPYEEQEELQEILDRDERTILIQLISPVTGKRMDKILGKAKGFVYCVSSMGVTGQSGEFHKEIINYLSSVKEKSPVPVMMGFGIRTAEDVRPMKEVIDGAIVGSHFIQLMRENNFKVKTATEYTKKFKTELNERQVQIYDKRSYTENSNERGLNL